MLSPFVGVDPVEQRINAGANWFYWIAGLTLVNSVAAYSGSSLTFFIGLGTTQVLDQLASSARVPGAALGIDAFVILTCAIVGQYARDSRPVYIAGMIAYGLDALIVLALRDVPGLGFHGFALWNLLRGLRAFGDLTARTRPHASERTVAVGAPETAS
jgi:hypothetical protein